MNKEKQIRDYIVENFLLGDEGGLSSSQSLHESGVIDSTGIMELVAFLEKSFQISVDDEDMMPENLDSIGSIAQFVERKLEGQAVGVESAERAES